MEPKGKGTAVSKALRYFTNSTKQKSIAFVLSDFIDAGYEDALRIAGKKHDVIGIKLYDPMDMKLPDAGLLQVEDAESGKTQWVDSSNAFVRYQYEQEFFRVTAYATQVFKKAGCDLLHVKSGEEYVKVLQRFSSAVTDDTMNDEPMIFRKTFFVLLLLFAGFMAGAQTAATVKAVVEKNRLLIGEQVPLTIEVQIPENEPIRFVTIDSIAHFEWVGKPVMDTIGNGNGTLLRGVYQLTSFDSGHWVIPPFELSGGLKTDSIPMDVVFSDFDPKAPYHDIRDILEADPQKKKMEWWWYAAAGGLLLILILVLVFRKKKPVVVAVKAEPVISPLNEALDGLRKLKSENPEPKPYHTRLADIFRMYVYRKKRAAILTEDYG